MSRILDFKMAPPVQRPGLVHRARLLERLERAEAPVIALIAPAGYGKTTLLSQFFAATAQRAAWLDLDETHDDPSTLLADLGHSLSEAGWLPDGSAPTLDSGSVLTRGVDRLLASISPDADALLILDHVDHLGSASSLDVIGALLTKARSRLRVVLASRSAAGLPFALLRTHGDLVDLTTDDLALDRSEIEAVLEAVGMTGPDVAEGVARTTEGWPAAVYLTALALTSGERHPAAGEVLGDDEYLVDYLRSEVLDGLPGDLRSFMVRSSILTRMSGDLCDHVLGIDDATHVLERLTDLNLMVVPLDRTRTWYRYHSLLRDYLRAECERELGTATSTLDTRASVWFEDHGFPDLAIDHARAAGDQARVADLLTRSARSFYDSGRYSTLATWFSWLEEQGSLRNVPELAAIGAFSRALGGDAGGAERLSLLANDDARGRPRDDGDLEPLTLMWRSYQAPRGVEAALSDALSAYEVLEREPDWTHTSLGAIALATWVLEGVEASDPVWADGLWRSKSIGAATFTTVAGAMRGIAAMRASAWDDADAHVSEAVAGIEALGLETYITSCLPYVAAARLAAHRGDLASGRRYLSAATALRPLLTLALPVYSVLTLHEMAVARIEYADVAGARRVMREANDILALRPRLGLLVDQHLELRDRLASLPAGTVGASSLTPAELRLLPLLVTHLTYPEIGDRLYLSRHTVKTQAMSIYRKLAVSSRSEAVERARGIGLISS